MGIFRNFRWVFGDILVVCVFWRIILVSCNISKINRVVGPSIPYKSLTPGVCNFKTLSLLKNNPNLGFITYTPKSWKHSYEKNKYVSYQNVEDTIQQGNYTSVRYEGLEPLYMKKPTESQVANLVKSDNNASLFSGDFLGSRLRSVRESFNKLNKNDLYWVTNKVGLFGLWYLGSLFFNVENSKVLNMFPLPTTVSALQSLLTVPFTTFRWLLNVEKPPEFYVPQFPLEKVDFKRDGFFSSVRKSLKNGVGRTRAYVKAYKTVLSQSSYSVLVQLFSYLFRTSAFPAGSGFLRSLEPLVVSLFTFLFEGNKMPNMAYLSLLPVAVGVAYATQGNFQPSSVSVSDVLKGLKSLPFFSLLSFAAMNSLRRDEVKTYFKQNLDKVGKNLTPSNLNTLSNLVGSLMMLPLALLEKDLWKSAYSNLMKNYSKGNYEFLKHLLLSSLAYGLVSQVTQLGFSDMSPVTQSVAHSVKNVLTMLTNSFYLDRKLTKKELLGTALTIAGTLLYSLTKDL